MSFNLVRKINISKVMLPDRLEGKTVVDINMRKKFNVNIIAIENNGGSYAGCKSRVCV